MRGPIGWHYSLLPLIKLMFYPFVFLVLWLFPFCLRDLVGGRSLGKWLFGLRVVEAADIGATPGAGALILRNLTIWASPVGLFVARRSEDRMRFGDRLAGTMVVENPQSVTGMSWGQTIVKAGVFSLVTVGCLWVMRTTTEAYHRGSRVYAAAVEFLNGCTAFREIAPEFSGNKLTLLLPLATDSGAIVLLGYIEQNNEKTHRLLVQMQRPADNLSAWEGVMVHAVFDPGLNPDNLSRSVLNTAAMSFLKTYGPLQREILDLNPAKARLTMVTVGQEKGRNKAIVVYQKKPDKWSADFGVVLELKEADWEVSDVQGVINLNLDNASAQRTFVFFQSRNLNRYLTAEEMGRFQGGQPLPNIVPEFRTPAPDAAPGQADNATGKR
jgi:hypothetical protein